MANVPSARVDHSPLPDSLPPVHGCPRDCGPCTWHASHCQLPVISITNACEMRCPVCFSYNRPDKHYFMSVNEMQQILDKIQSTSGAVDLVNITGGEPTMHPHLLDILECCRRKGIGRITMNSNGLRLAHDTDLCSQLAEVDVQVVLSFNTLGPEAAMKMHGRDVVEAKLKALENLTNAGVNITLLNVMARDLNEGAAGDILDVMRKNDRILSLTVQTMTYTGQGGASYPRTRHIPADEAARIICKQSRGEIEFDDFQPRESAHPLCYQVCYLLKAGETFLPFARFASQKLIASMMRESYLIRLEDTRTFFADSLNQLYADGRKEHLRVFRQLIESMYPRDQILEQAERQRVADSAVRTIYVHAHMDDDTFDCSRAMMCPDLVAEPARLIPACTYNLFYRMQDERFHAKEPQ